MLKLTLMTLVLYGVMTCGESISAEVKLVILIMSFITSLIITGVSSMTAKLITRR